MTLRELPQSQAPERDPLQGDRHVRPGDQQTIRPVALIGRIIAFFS